MRTQFFRVHGSDGRSDNGYWEVIVRCVVGADVKAMVEEHLREQGRSDLIASMEVDVIASPGTIIHSTVQSER